MTSLYLIRHCEALGNRQRLFQGSTDFDISEIGAIQLQFLSERFADIYIDCVYSSPLIRAKKTALAVAEPKGIDVIEHSGLKELDGGIVEGRPFAEAFASIPGLADIWDNHPQDFAPEGGEPMKAAYDRIWDTISEIVSENLGKVIVVATHGGVLRCLFARLLHNDINKLNSVEWNENTAVSLIEFDDKLNPTVIFKNDFSHVPDEYMPKRSRIASFIGDKK